MGRWRPRALRWRHRGRAHPPLVLDEADDPEGAPLTWSFALSDFDGVELDSGSGVSGDGTQASWTPDGILAEGETWCWHGKARRPARGAWKVPPARPCFLVDTADQPPGPPSILAPELTSTADTLTPEITVLGGVDPEGRATVQRFEPDTDPAFGSPERQSVTVETGGDGTGISAVDPA